MLVVLIMIVAVLIGLAYADYCLVDNTAHFGITFRSIEEAKDDFAARLRHVVEAEKEADEELMDGESDFVVPPAVGVPDVAARKAVRPARRSPPLRPGSRTRNSGPFPAIPSPDAGAAAIGT